MSEPTGHQLGQALDALARMRVRLEAAERAGNEPIAIVGIGCRFPGNVRDAASFWILLTEGIDGVIEVPSDRWDVASVYDSDPRTAGKTSTRWGGFIDDVRGFDAAFFDISPREAMRMDPQQRLLLEVAWNALEDAGQDPSGLRGSATGVFVGVHSHSSDYWMLQAGSPRALDAYAGPGTSHSVMAGRLSYLLDLRGPSLAVDTACSSSLVAVHLATQALRTRECDLALAGGVNVILAPEFTIAASRMQMLAADGRCKAFDARADGFVRSEGCGVVVLKRLSDALAAGDPIRAVIRGTAVNQDGRTNGLTAPNGRSQEALMRRALERAGVAAEEIGYVEAHGTGTPLGDPIEMEALAAVIGGGLGAPCLVGSVKTNIGHLEGAAGVAGLIKTVLALQNGMVPAHLHFQRLNPHITPSAGLAIPTTLSPWAAGRGRRCAGVSSFGWSGTNAHVVLEAPPTVAAAAPPAEQHAFLLPLSARSEPALTALAQAYHDALAGPESLGNLIHTAAERRMHHEHRLAVVGRSAETLRQGLVAYLAQRAHPAVLAGCAQKARAPIIFLFPGQGSQWAGMGRRLLSQEPHFREALERCDAGVHRETGWSVIERLRSPDAETEAIDVVQPMLFAMAVALAALWQAWGIRPAAVVGHSLGEVAAAHVAGALELDDAVRVICCRSRLLRRLSGRGAMAAVELPLAEAQAAIAGLADRIAVAASNGPRSTVISGDPAPLEALLRSLRARNVFARLVKVDVASHSPQVDELAPELLRELQEIRPRAGTVPIYSTVTGRLIDGARLDAAYWVHNLRQPVLLTAAVEQALEAGAAAVVEVSPHPILLSAVEDITNGVKRTVVPLPSLRRDADELTELLTSLGRLYCLGGPVRWSALRAPGARPAVAPGYPWQHHPFWLEEPDEPVAPEPRSGSRGKTRQSRWHVAWRPEPSDYAGEVRAGRWLLLADRGTTSRALRAELERRGHHVVSAHMGAEYAVSSAGDFVIDPQHPEQFRRLLQEVERPGDAWAGVAHLWGLDAPAVGPGDDAAAVPDVGAVCAGVLHLVQTLGDTSRLADARLWVVTRGAQTIGDDDSPALAQTPLWGLGPVIGIEHPVRWGGLVDLDPQADPAEVQAFADELCGPPTGERVGFRAGRRYVARLEQSAPAGGSAAPPLRPDRAYVVTGGLGGIGRRLARWLVDRGARNVVLVGRHASAEASRDLIADLEVTGARVMIESADVADREALAALLTRVVRTLAPLGGIFHAAAVLDDGVVDRLDADRVQAVLRPKVAGAWHLHTLTRELDLDYFILFSSATAILGTPGQAAYASANSFLDGLAHLRRAARLPALAISWGRWGEVGLAAHGERAEHMARLGFQAMAPDAALATLGRAMAEPAAQLTIMAFDPEAYRRSLPGRALPVLGSAGALVIGRPAPDLLDALRGAPPAARRDLLLELVRAQTAAVLRLDEPTELDPARGFFTLGMDSLMAVELKNRLQATLGLPLPSTVVFDRPSIGQLAEILEQALFGERSGNHGAPPAPAGDEIEAIRRLPRQQVEALLADELAQVREWRAPR